MGKRLNKTHRFSRLLIKDSGLSKNFAPRKSDVLGSYTGNSVFNDRPEQDADDL